MGAENRVPRALDRLERRVVVNGSARVVEPRDDGGDADGLTLVGHAAVFGVWASIGGWFEESVRKGAFRNAIAEGQDVRCLFNHSADWLLGRTAAGTLRLWEDATGLAYECKLPRTALVGDLVAGPIRRGDLTQCSFSFGVRSGGAIWTRVEQGDGKLELWRRELVDVDLFDVGPVTFPAYDSTDCGLRTWEREAELRATSPAASGAGVRDAGVDMRRAMRLRLAGAC